MKEKICVIGLGYIGLPTAAMFASNGHQVVGVDVNKEVVNALKHGKITIEEPYLSELVEQAVINKNLRASMKPCESEVFIIAVPTPITKEKKADMKYVIEATKSIVPYLKKGDIVILESTSPTGTVVELMKPILEKTGLDIGEDIYLGHSPERVLPGQILFELVNNNRIVGGLTPKSAEKIKKIYQSFVKGEIFVTDATTAELCKMMENTYRDVNIALANELAKICESSGINAWEVIELCNKHPRVSIHQPGPGVGGHCLAVDPWFIVEKEPELAKIIKLARETNDFMPEFVFNKINSLLKDVKGKKKVTILGITYKPNIDDIRESPIIKLIELLEAAEYEIAVVDPYVEVYPLKVENIEDAVNGSDLIILAVNHSEFSSYNYSKLAQLMRTPQCLDTRNSKIEGIRVILLGDGR